MKFLLVMVIAYVAGSVNFSIILFRLLGRDDPRKSFSGNAGTTNVYRLAGPHWAALVLLLDVGRAVAVALLAVKVLAAGQAPWAGLALVAGNRFPCFHRFEGGKGVANYLGFTAVITPVGAVLSCAAWVLVYPVSRAPFIASFAMVAVLSIATMVVSGFTPGAVIGAALTALFIILNHGKNITAWFGKMNREEGEDEDEDHLTKD
ncbi:MAG: glycerol-3-phosphate acyltransferase [Spirochaetes bacterium]|nr:glycerol-3-phosphate acyltransferase [Spirochaetota bacterium]